MQNLHVSNGSILRHTQISIYLALNACIKVSEFEYGLKIIDCIQIETQNKNNINVKLLNTMMNFYGKMGDIDNVYCLNLTKNLLIVSML